MSHKQQVQDLIDGVNKLIKSDCPGFDGEFSIVDDADIFTDNTYAFSIQPDSTKHFVIDYNFSDDEASDKVYINGVQCELQLNHYNKLFDRFDELCQSIWQLKCEADNDGSGNGLWYGGMLMAI